MSTLSRIIYHTNGPQLWSLYDQVAINPPVMKMVIGHPKKMWNKVNDEPKNPYVLPRNLRITTCHKYEAMRDNKRSYKGKIVIEIAIPKGGNNKKEMTRATEGEKNIRERHVQQRVEIRRRQSHVQ